MYHYVSSERGHEFDRWTAQKADVLLKGLQAGMILYDAQTCVLLDHQVACWNVLPSDQARIDPLLAQAKCHSADVLAKAGLPR